jgi:CHAT domain-containing protein
MSDPPEPCYTLAAVLAGAEDPRALLPDELPCTPLELLIALHQEVTQTMLSDLAQARRAAAAAEIVAWRFPGDSLLQAQVHWSQGSATLYIPDYAGSLEHYDAALTLYAQACQELAPAVPSRDIRIVQIVRVFCLSELGRYREAQQAVELAALWLREHPNDYAELTLLLNRSQLAGNMGDYVRMVDLADATIVLAVRLKNPARMAHGWINRALACVYLGRFAEADEAIVQGIAAASAAGEPLTIGRALSNRAILLRCTGQLFAALSTLGEAERLRAQAPGEAAILALDKAGIYEQLCQLPDAQRSARQAASLFMQQSMPMYSASAALRAVCIAVRQQQATVAHSLLRLAKAQAAQVDMPLLQAEIALAEAEITLLPAHGVSERVHGQRCRAARAAARQAVDRFHAHGLVQESTAGQLTLAALDTQLGNREAARASYHSLLQHTNPAIRLVAHAKLGALLPPADALPYVRQAAVLAVEQRRALPMEELQARYSSETSPHHTRLAACHLALGDIVQAFESVCAAKAGPLLDLRASAGLSYGGSFTILESAKITITRWREQERDHTRKAVDAIQQAQHERAAYHMQCAQAAAAELQSSEQQLTATLRTLADRSAQARVPNLAEIQAALPIDMALLEYAQIEGNLVCFLVQHDRPPVFQSLGPAREIAPLLDRWSLICRRLMNNMQSSDAAQQIGSVLAPLWNLLVRPWNDALETVDHLLLAPWGILHHVPWAALFDGAAYLNDRVTLTLTPCSAMWAAPLEQLNRPLLPPQLLGHAGQGAEHLGHVAAELSSIARHLPDAQIFPAATAANLRSTAPPRILHIAAHAMTNPVAPLCSTIELADGPFLLLEAHRLDLRGTELVVLSACETSVRPDYGDMALALAGAFLCTGARAVVASLWKVSDVATAALMEQFYVGLSTGMSPAAALRQAQRQMRAAYPLDWAAFQLWAGAR